MGSSDVSADPRSHHPRIPTRGALGDLLAARLRAASYHTAPFRLRLGALACFQRPEDGVYIDVQDIVIGNWSAHLAQPLAHPNVERKIQNEQTCVQSLYRRRLP